MIGRMKFEIDALVDEILDRLPEEAWTSPTTTFLDPAIGGGQFVRSIEARLRKAGHSDANISQRVFGFEKGDLNIRYAVNKYGLIGQYSRVSYDELFEKGIDMKFDVVVGNPPYNPPTKDDSGGSGSGNKIWQKFIEASFQNLKENGIVIMVTPTNWRHGNFNEKRHHKRAQQLMFDYGIQEWHSANHHFPKVGVEIDWWICSRNVKFIPEVLKNSYFLPKNMDDASLSIYSDWLSFLKNECYVVDIKDNRSYDFSHTKGEIPIDNVHVYKHVVTGSKTQNGFFHWYDQKTKGFDSKKVIVFGSSGPNPIYDKEGKIGCGHHATGYQVKNDFEAQEIIDFFNSKICDFLASEASSRKGFEFPKELFKRIPKNWRELEEKHFG